jgi:hypothetical protein
MPSSVAPRWICPQVAQASRMLPALWIDRHERLPSRDITGMLIAMHKTTCRTRLCQACDAGCNIITRGGQRRSLSSVELIVRVRWSLYKNPGRSVAVLPTEIPIRSQ